MKAGHNWARGVFQARTRAGLSQSALEQTIGVTHGYVSHIEAGRKVPSLGVLESIADACGVRLFRLVWVAESSPTSSADANPKDSITIVEAAESLHEPPHVVDICDRPECRQARANSKSGRRPWTAEGISGRCAASIGAGEHVKESDHG